MSSTSDTPPLARWIKSFRDTREHPRYLNVFDTKRFPRRWKLHNSDRPALFGTESLYGRWSDAAVWILARDAGTKWSFIPSSERGRGFRWEHDPSRPTNSKLKPYADSLRCPILYGSAMSCLVADTSDPEKSESFELDEFYDERAMRFAGKVLQWSLARLPRLRLVICLGQDSWRVTMNAIGDPRWAKRFSEIRGTKPQPRNALLPNIKFGAVYHTGKHFFDSSRPAEWKEIRRALQ